MGLNRPRGKSWSPSRAMCRGLQPFVIAEIGVNHDGSVERAGQLIDAATDAGAGAVKLQYFTAAALLSRSARLADYQRSAGAADTFEMLGSLELPLGALPDLIAQIHERQLIAIVTAFSLEHVEPLANMNWDAFKVASPDLVNTPLLKAIEQVGRPVILSTGAANEQEIASTIAHLGDAIMHCTSAYPTPAEQTHLGAIASLDFLVSTLRPDRVIPVGFSDHTTGLDTGALAVAAGALFLEKHFTHDRAAPGPDHGASLDADGLAQYIALANDASVRLGSAQLTCHAIEEEVRTISRQSVVAARDLSPGHTIQSGDLAIKRPGSGIPAADLDRIVGCTTKKRIGADTPIRFDDLADAPTVTPVVNKPSAAAALTP